MSYLATRWAYTSPEVLNAGLSHTDLLVLRALCWFCNDDSGIYERGCCPGVDRICRVTGLKSAAVHNAKRRLGDKGLISWVRGNMIGPETFETNSYRIECPKLVKRLKANQEMRRYQQLKAEGKSPGEDVDLEPTDSQSAAPAAEGPRHVNASWLRDVMNAALTDDETAWLVDALNFVGDSPANREKLLDAYRAAGNPVACRQTLVRVIKRAVFKMNMTDKCAYLHSSIVNLARKSGSFGPSAAS